MPYPTRLVVACLLAYLGLAASAARGDTVRYAENFTIETRDAYRLVTVNQAGPPTAGLRYALLPKGAPMPKNLPAEWQVIRTPVERVVAMETVTIGHLEALGKLESIVGAATVDFISNPTIRAGLAKGTVESVQSGQAINIENLLAIQPDLILTSVLGDPAFEASTRLRRSGLPVVFTASYLEEHPLARAEWIKFFAAFVDETPRANQLFADIERRYLELAALADGAETRPTVLCGAPYSGTWHVPGGRSYMARTIADAGGDYLWADTPASGSIPLDLERVFIKAANASIWLNPSHYRSLTALLAADPRFAKFAPARNGAVYNNTRRVSPGGGNAIWESGIVRPDDVLADLIHIFQPEMLPGHELVYYEALQ